MRKVSLLAALVLLAGCAEQKKREAEAVAISDGRPEQVLVDITVIPDAIPRYEPWSPSVNPESYVVLGKTYRVLPSNKGFKQQGIASWYGTKFHQKKTATGETYDMFKMTAAHKTLPIPSYVQVTNLDNQRSVIVKVNDRGPFHQHRIIDLSYAAAVKLGIEQAGTGFVEIRAVQPGGAKVVAAAKAVYYQVGAFSVLENASALQEKIAMSELAESRIVQSVTPERSLFKLQIGPISSVTEAEDMTRKLQKIGIHSGHYVSE